MFNRFARSRATIGALLVTSALFSASLVAPALGAPGPLTLAKRALKTAKKADKTANSANKRSKKANSTANGSDQRSKSASSIAISATSVANSALAKANGPGNDAGPGAFEVSDSVQVPDDGTEADTSVGCPSGFVPAGGGVDVFDGSNGDPVRDGLAITESASTIGVDGWEGAVQDDPDHASSVSDREMEVTVQCAKVTHLVGADAHKRSIRNR